MITVTVTHSPSAATYDLFPIPFSQAIKAGNTIYVSGQIGLVPGTKDFASPDVEGQTEQVQVVACPDSRLEKKCNQTWPDLSHFHKMNL